MSTVKPAKFLLDIELTDNGASIASDIQGRGIDIVYMVAAYIEKDPTLVGLFKNIALCLQLKEDITNK